DRRRKCPDAAESDDGRVVVGRDAYQLRAPRLARGEPDRERVCALDDMVVGDDVAGLVPDEAGAALHRLLLAARWPGIARTPGAEANDLNHRRRHALEDGDGRAFIVGEIATRLDRPRRGRGVKPVLD